MKYDGKLNVMDIWPTIQGEGLNAGAPTVFVRLQGCPFRCTWCDSPDSQPYVGANLMTPDEAYQKVVSYGIENVCITGGEPLTQDPEALKKFVMLLTLSLKVGRIEIEHSGHYPLPTWWLYVDSWIVDLKCPGSGQSHVNNFSIYNQLRSRDQIVCVVKDLYDYEYAQHHLSETKSDAQIWIHPVWSELKPLAVASWLLTRPIPGARLGVQLHKYIWGGRTTM